MRQTLGYLSSCPPYPSRAGVRNEALRDGSYDSDHVDVDRPSTMLGHKDVRTTMIYLHVMNKPGLAVRSPVDALE